MIQLSVQVGVQDQGHVAGSDAADGPGDTTHIILHQHEQEGTGRKPLPHLPGELTQRSVRQLITLRINGGCRIAGPLVQMKYHDALN